MNHVPVSSKTTVEHTDQDVIDLIAFTCGEPSCPPLFAAADDPEMNGLCCRRCGSPYRPLRRVPVSEDRAPRCRG